MNVKNDAFWQLKKAANIIKQNRIYIYVYDSVFERTVYFVIMTNKRDRYIRYAQSFESNNGDGNYLNQQMGDLSSKSQSVIVLGFKEPDDNIKRIN